MRPLDGIRVLDFTTLLSGSMASLVLAEAGAEVIKIEPIGGDRLRNQAPMLGETGADFAVLNRGKKSLVVDMRASGALRRLTKLIESADVLIDDRRPGDIDRPGLEYAEVEAINGRLIYCAITGWGQEGPQANVEASGLNCGAETGLLSLRAASEGGLALPTGPVSDIAAGSFPAVINILMALRHRDQTGRGCKLDVAVADAMFTFQYWAIAQAAATDQWPVPGKELLTGGSPRYQIYETADGKFVAVAAIDDRHWENLCERLELDEELRDRNADPETVGDTLSAIFRARNAKFWREKFENRDIGCSIVASLQEAIANPHFQERGLFDRKVAVGDKELPAVVVPVQAAFRDVETVLDYPALDDAADLLEDG